ncbi:hypothetical protein COOONC_16774 [Cooperia oncophora]
MFIQLILDWPPIRIRTTDRRRLEFGQTYESFSNHKRYSTVVDVGCGEAKYTCPSVLVLGVDTCADALIGRTQKSHDPLDLLLADALTLPFR